MTTPEPSNTTNIVGDVHGSVLSGTFTGSVTVTTAAPRPARPPAFQVPYPPNPLFVGRHAQLAELAKALTTDSSVILTPVIAGMGGVGKTQLASEFAHQQRNAFPGGVFWLNMEQPDAIATQVAACAGEGGLNLPKYEAMDLDQRLAQVKAAWAQAEPRRLIIFDNLEDPKILNQWRPFVGASRLLITSRRDDWSLQFKRVRLTVLERSESCTLLLRPRAEELGAELSTILADPAMLDEANQICEALGDLPLALVIAGTYLRLSANTTLRSYRQRIASNPLADEQRASAIMAEVLAEAGLPTGRERGIIATFAISYQQLNAGNATDELALTMLNAAAYCAPVPIPQDILWRVGGLASESLDDQERGDAAIRRLRMIGLLALEADGDPPLVSVHRLIAAYLRSLLNGADIQRTLGVALTNAGNAAVNSGYPRQSAPLVAHFLHLAAQPHDDDASGYLYGALASVYEQQSNYAEALPLLQRALAIRETALGPQHPDIATSLNNLAELYRTTGNYAEALPLYQRALVISETALGPLHPNTAGSLNNLALLYESTGNYTEALPLYQRALAIKETALGPQHPDTATSLNNLAVLYESTGNYDEALPLYQRALAIHETALGPQHPDTASSLNNLAALYNSMGNYGEALPLYQRALAISEATLGPQHPTTATSLNNLAVFYAYQGDFDQAIRFIERALLIRERTLGAQHPDTQQTQQSLQNMLIAQLPTSLREALQRNDGAAFQHALQQLDAADHATAITIIQKLQALQQPQSAPSDPLTQLMPLLEAIAAIAQGSEQINRDAVEQALADLEQQGFMLRTSVARIWQGERDAATLTNGLDEMDTAIITRILEGVFQH